MSIGTAGAPAQVFKAKHVHGVRERVNGLPNVTMDMLPVFSPSPYALWGRADFLMTFVVTIDEKNEQFTLHW